MEKIDTQIKKEKLFENINDPEQESKSDNLKFLSNRLDKQNNNLNKANLTGSNIIETQTRTAKELERQRGVLTNANDMITEVEKELSLHDQLVNVMNNRELFNKLKLVIVIALLFIADILILYIKFF